VAAGASEVIAFAGCSRLSDDATLGSANRKTGSPGLGDPAVTDEARYMHCRRVRLTFRKLWESKKDSRILHQKLLALRWVWDPVEQQIEQ
jgi:hypothetical protein